VAGGFPIRCAAGRLNMTLLIACILIYQLQLPPWLYAVATLVWLGQIAATMFAFNWIDERLIRLIRRG
jgi:hypothetical protein